MSRTSTRRTRGSLLALLLALFGVTPRGTLLLWHDHEDHAHVEYHLASDGSQGADHDHLEDHDPTHVALHHDVHADHVTRGQPPEEEPAATWSDNSHHHHEIEAQAVVSLELRPCFRAAALAVLAFAPAQSPYPDKQAPTLTRLPPTRDRAGPPHALVRVRSTIALI